MQTLNDIMEPDHVIRITPDGEVDDVVANVWAPELHVDTDGHGSILDEHDQALIQLAEHQGWLLLNGWSGQFGYSGPLMHASEHLGGRLEEHIRETPGLYCLIYVDTDEDEPQFAGWVVAFREQ